MDSQGDAGQFRTPRHIIDFIVEVVDPKKDETILDPACGTAGFLISSYKHILKQNTIHRLGDQLTPDEKTKLMQHFVGYDISPDMVKLSLVNMYLHSFPNPNVFEYDTLTSEERWDDTYDVIMANPPFMTPKGGIRPHKRFSIQVNRSEVLFVDYIAEHLTTNGRAGVIVPEGIIFQSGIAYKALRKMLVEKYLFAVVSLPGGIFQPYSGVKTSILLMDKQLAKKAESILFVKVENDGFDLGAQRRPIEKNDLTKALVILQQYKQALQSGEDPRTILSDSKVSSMAVLAEKSQIAKNGDYNLSGERYRESIVKLHQKWPMVELGEVCEINPKKSEIKTVSPDTVVSFVPMSDLSDNGMFFEIKQTKKLSDVLSGYTYFCNNDVLLAKVTPCFENGKSGIAQGLKNNIGFGSSEFVVLRSSERIIPELVYRFVSSERFREMGIPQMTGTGGLQRLPTSFISNFQIPLPPLEVQKEIVAELDNYQKIISGASQVVESYKPAIKIEPDWKTVELGELCEIKGGKRIPKGLNFSNTTTQHPYLRVIDFNNNTINQTNLKYIDEEVFNQIKNYTISSDDVYISIAGTIGLTGTIPGNLNGANLTENAAKLVIKNKVVLDKNYLVFILANENAEHQIKRFTHAVGVPKLALERIKLIKIPLPSIDIQKQISAQIEQEQKLVEANKSLIEIFEQKIKDKIAEVWGTDITPNDDYNAPSNGTFKHTQPVQAEIEQAELELG